MSKYKPKVYRILEYYSTILGAGGYAVQRKRFIGWKTLSSFPSHRQAQKYLALVTEEDKTE